jgi:hypothetical protein
MNKKTFWLTNISDRNVSLADLNLTIKAFSSVNLLDKKHYSYTEEQLLDSVAKGSVFKKRNKIVVRNNPPKQTVMNLPYVQETYIPTRQRSLLNIKDEKYEELSVSDEAFANENAEIAEQDRLPLLKKA